MPLNKDSDSGCYLYSVWGWIVINSQITSITNTNFVVELLKFDFIRPNNISIQFIWLFHRTLKCRILVGPTVLPTVLNKESVIVIITFNRSLNLPDH